MLRLISLFVLASVCAAQGKPSLDLLIRGGTVVDGTGRAGFVADVGVRGGRVVALGRLGEIGAVKTLEAEGLIVAPGFIDVHTHADRLERLAGAPNFVAMGVTTIVSGNCGYSNKQLGNVFARLEKGGVAVNYASLIGHGTLREAVLGKENRAPSEEELAAMCALLRRELQAGGVGMSTGLIYVPGTFATEAELVALARVVADHDGVYATHMRNEGDGLLAAVEETIRIGAATGVRVQMSHLKASGKPNWGRSAAVLERLRRARAQGVRITGDQYAYTASSTSIDVLFPSAELTIGRKEFGRRLRDDAAFRARMRESLLATMDRTGFGDLAYCRISHAPNNTNLNGMTIAAAAAGRGDASREAQAELAMDLVGDAAGRRVTMIYHKMSEDDVAAYMRAPFVAVASDSGVLRRTKGAGGALPHPRGSGNNARVLAEYVRERGAISLPRAIVKMTSLPASTFGLRDRGVVRIGAWADLVVFDREEIRDRATYDEPFATPTGIHLVVVNGVPVVEDGAAVREARPGAVLRRQDRLRTRVDKD